MIYHHKWLAPDGFGGVIDRPCAVDGVVRTVRRHGHPVGRPPSHGRRRRSPQPDNGRPPLAAPGAALNRTEAPDVVNESIARIIPHADFTTLGPDDKFREGLEVDSLNPLGFIEPLSERTRVRIDDEDTPQLTTLSGAADFLVARTE